MFRANQSQHFGGLWLAKKAGHNRHSSSTALRKAANTLVTFITTHVTRYEKSPDFGLFL